jgi:hypothetical protein
MITRIVSPWQEAEKVHEAVWEADANCDEQPTLPTSLTHIITENWTSTPTSADAGEALLAIPSGDRLVLSE